MTTQHASALLAAVCAFLSSCPLVLSAQSVDSAMAEQSEAKPIPAVVMRVRRVSPPQAGIGGRIYVDVDSLSQAMKRDGVQPRNFVLYLNGHPIWNAEGRLVDAASGRLEFELATADTSRTAWVALLGSPKGLVKPGVSVGVGYGHEPEVQSVDAIPPTVSLTVIQRWRLVVGGLIVLSFLVGFFLLVRRSNIIRDAFPPFPASGKKKPYSLSRLQMAIWFFLVFVAFVFLNLITHNVDTLNAQALMLMGIGTLTALGSVVVDNSKKNGREAKLDKLRPERASVEAEIAALETLPMAGPPMVAGAYSVAGLPSVQLAEKRARLTELNVEITQLENARGSPTSTNLIDDVLSDDGGISLHRFQMMAWTLILGAMFLIAVWERLAMPEFSATLLSLMGISAGTYLGFKVPEKGD